MFRSSGALDTGSRSLGDLRAGAERADLVGADLNLRLRQMLVDRQRDDGLAVTLTDWEVACLVAEPASRRLEVQGDGVVNLDLDAVVDEVLVEGVAVHCLDHVG